MTGLEKLTKFTEKLDKEILRGYSKITKKWEDKGRSRYLLSGLCDVISGLFLGKYSIFNIGGLSLTPFFGVSMGNSFNGIITGKHLTGIEEENGKFIVNDKLSYFVDNFGKTVRTPELIAGIGFAGKGVFDLYNYFVNNDSSSLSEGLENLDLGISLVSNSSAWYIRDSDPKLLDKKPLWKQAFEKMSKKVVSYLPQPEARPLPVKINFQKHLKVNNSFS